MYGSQGTPNPRRDSLEVVLAQFETTLEQHSTLIEKMVHKVEGMDRTLIEVKTQMEHLVTKESCAEGRRELSGDLKARMDGDREITGVGITVPKLWQQYVEATRGPIAPAPAQQPASASKSRPTSSTPPPPKSVLYYIKAISSIVSLVFAVLAITFFAFRMVSRLDEQQTAMRQQQAVMQDIQRELKQIDSVERNEEVPVDLHPMSFPSTPPVKNH